MSIILRASGQSMRVSNITLEEAVDIAIRLAGSPVHVVMEPSPVAKVQRGPQG